MPDLAIRADMPEASRWLWIVRATAWLVAIGAVAFIGTRAYLHGSEYAPLAPILLLPALKRRSITTLGPWLVVMVEYAAFVLLALYW